MLMAPHTHPRHGRHGNPEDLQAYIAKMVDPGRDEWQRPADVLRAFGLKRRQTVCDIGAGPGYFALRIAAAGRSIAEAIPDGGAAGGDIEVQPGPRFCVTAMPEGVDPCRAAEQRDGAD
jgi:DNA-binding transcriptional LysR family regulator